MLGRLLKRLNEVSQALNLRFRIVITPQDKEWELIQTLQQSGKLPWLLRQVIVHTIPRQYEREVKRIINCNILEVKLIQAHPLLSVSPHYMEVVHHHTCYAPSNAALIVLLKKHESMKDLPFILQNSDIFTPPATK